MRYAICLILFLCAGCGGDRSFNAEERSETLATSRVNGCENGKCQYPQKN